MKKLLAGILLAGCCVSLNVMADEFTGKDVEEWYRQYMTVVQTGEKLFHSALGSNSVSCDQCHPNAANTHPETYPKFQKQLGKVATIFEMINWCIRNPAEGQPLAADDPDMIALIAYMTHERRGTTLEPGKH